MCDKKSANTWLVPRANVWQRRLEVLIKVRISALATTHTHTHHEYVEEIQMNGET